VTKRKNVIPPSKRTFIRGCSASSCPWTKSATSRSAFAFPFSPCGTITDSTSARVNGELGSSGLAAASAAISWSTMPRTSVLFPESRASRVIAAVAPTSTPYQSIDAAPHSVTGT